MRNTWMLSLVFFLLECTDAAMRPLIVYGMHRQAETFSGQRCHFTHLISFWFKSPQIWQQRDQTEVWQACSHQGCLGEMGAASSTDVHPRARGDSGWTSCPLFEENAPSGNIYPVSQGKTAEKSGKPVMQKPTMPGMYRFSQSKLWVAPLRRNNENVWSSIWPLDCRITISAVIFYFILFFTRYDLGQELHKGNWGEAVSLGSDKKPTITHGYNQNKGGVDFFFFSVYIKGLLLKKTNFFCLFLM